MGQEEIDRRLRRVEGQIRGLQRMVEQERECEAVFTQLIAARSALDSVALMIVEKHMQECLASTDPVQAQLRLRRMLEMVFSRYSLLEQRNESTAGLAEPHDMMEE